MTNTGNHSGSKPPVRESFQHQGLIEFNGHRTALGFREPGDKIEWFGTYSHADMGLFTGSDCAIITTESGTHYAVGEAAVAKLPDYDKETGKFGELGDKMLARRLEHDLSDVVIGETWTTPFTSDAGTTDPVISVMFDYKIGGPMTPDHQLSQPSPFDSARQHLIRVSGALSDLGR